MTYRYDVIDDVFIAQDNEWFAFYALASILAVTVRILKCINSCCTSDCVTPHVSICHMRDRTCHISVTCRFTCYMCVMCVKSVTYFQMSFSLKILTSKFQNFRSGLVSDQIFGFLKIWEFGILKWVSSKSMNISWFNWPKWVEKDWVWLRFGMNTGYLFWI